MSAEQSIEEMRERCEIQPGQIWVDKEVLIRAISAAEDAVEFISESLAKHDADLGRVVKRHKAAARYMEEHIADAKAVVNEMRLAIGWPSREWRS
jgi:hypothetical protein